MAANSTMWQPLSSLLWLTHSVTWNCSENINWLRFMQDPVSEAWWQQPNRFDHIRPDSCHQKKEFVFCNIKVSKLRYPMRHSILGQRKMFTKPSVSLIDSVFWLVGNYYNSTYSLMKVQLLIKLNLITILFVFLMKCKICHEIREHESYQLKSDRNMWPVSIRVSERLFVDFCPKIFDMMKANP